MGSAQRAMPRAGGLARDYFRDVADDLIARIEDGTAAWTQAWKPGERGLPHNLLTGKPYRGLNTVRLASTALARGWQDPRWGTYRQIRETGGQVRRGQQGTRLVYWQFEDRRVARDQAGRPLKDEHGKPVYESRPRSRPRARPFWVFNAEQADGLPRPDRSQSPPKWQQHEGAERIIAGSGAVVEHSGDNRACYDLQRDRIILPYREQFPDAPTYYQTALHELGHWTGHPDRLNRETLTKGLEHGFASRMYAREELRAEISSMITGVRLNLGHDPSRHAGYVGGWIEALQDDPREIHRAAKDAQRISDHVVALAHERDKDKEKERGQEADRPVRRLAVTVALRGQPRRAREPRSWQWGR